MSNISGQFIKDSFNYVLQSDLITGVVYRIGGNVVENPKFISGLTVNQSFTYSDGSEFPGYVLTCDASGNAIWGPVSGVTSGVVVTGGTFDYSGGTLTLGLSNGVLVPISGLQDIYVTGGVVSGNSIVFTYNDTNTFEVSGITSFDTFTSYTASTQVGINNKLDTSGFTAYTATTQPLMLNAITGGTYSGGTLYLVTNSGNTVQITGFSISQSGETVSGEYLPLSGGTVTGQTQFTSGLTANTISATTYFNLPVTALTSGNYISITGSNGNFTVSFTGSIPTQGITGITGMSGVSAVTTNFGTTIINTSPDQTVTISGGTGITTGGTYPNFTLVNSAPDQTVTLTGGTNIQIVGTYPNFGVNFTGTTGSNFTGGTVNGATNFTNGLTANTISATTISGDTFYGNGSNLTNVPNIYNSNGTIQNDRYVNISGNTLWFSGLSKGFQVRISDVGPKNGLIFTSDSLGGPSFSAFENGNVLFEGPTEFQNTSQFSSTVSMISLVPDITSPYLLGLNNSSEVTTFDSNYLLNSISGGSFSAQTLYLTNNTGGTVVITGFTSGSGSFTGGTVTGATNFTNGLTANTISATTYQNLPLFTGGTVSGETKFTGGLSANTINILDTPTLNNSPTQILTRNTTTGRIEYTTPQQVKTVGNNLYLFYNY